MINKLMEMVKIGIDGSLPKATAEKLAARIAESLIKSKRVIVLPCEVGDTVYKIKHYYDCSENKFATCELYIYDESNCIRCHENVIVYYINPEAFELFMLKDIGKTVFFSREEAEAKLNELKSRKEDEGK